MRYPTGDDEVCCYLELATLPSAPFWARRQAGAVLRAWQLPADEVEAARLIVSELVTNAVRAVGSDQPATLGTYPAVQRIALALRLLPGRIVIEVSDSHPGPPVLAEAGLDAESGRGLVIVQALAKEWGYYCPPAGGKTVYAVLGAETGRALP